MPCIFTELEVYTVLYKTTEYILLYLRERVKRDNSNIFKIVIIELLNVPQ